MTDQILRGLIVAVWTVLTISLIGSVMRGLRRKAKDQDSSRAGFAFVGLIFIGFNLRWFIAADDVATRHALQALCLGLAVYVWRLTRAGSHDHG